MASLGSQIVGTGSAFPAQAMTNADFESFLDTSDEWIRTRTGIRERRIADPAKNESTLSLAKAAAEQALEKAGIRPEDLELIVIGTVTPNNIMPSTANQLQAALGASRAFGFDLSAACSGWVYGLSIADHFIRAGTVKNALVIGAETLSTILNWKDRTTCVLFGDGAGAVVLKATEGDRRVLSMRLRSDGSYGELLCIPHGFSKVPPRSAAYRLDGHTIHMQGKEIFKLAVRCMVETGEAALRDAGLTTRDIDLFLFHQANIRIIDMCAKILGVTPDKTWINVDRYGNTSAATLPVCLDEAWRAGRVKEGSNIFVATFGGGLTWGAGVFRL